MLSAIVKVLNMASSRPCHLKDIDEKFCQCSICLQQYREPKQLPCLHRYCSNCLKQLIERNQGIKVINCPECSHEVKKPTNGVDGFKADFHMKNIIEYFQIQKSLEDELRRKCYGCSKLLKVTAYCFKCNGFLCKDCYEYHMTNKSVEYHKQDALSLEHLKSKHITLEKLGNLKEAPRCGNHPDDVCRLCCRTCDNLPICLTCTFGSHKNHDINDVGIVAAEKRERLKHALHNLNQYRERIVLLPKMVDNVKKELIANVGEQKKKFTQKYEKDLEMAKKEMKILGDDYSFRQTELANEEKTRLMETWKQINEEMNHLKMKYDNICDEIKEERRIKSEDLNHKHEDELKKSKTNLAILEEKFHNVIETLETRQEHRLMELRDFSHEINNIRERYENLTKTGHSVLETRNDWTAVQCIPDICKAVEPLSEDMKREFPELYTLSRIWLRSAITEDEQSPVDIEGIKINNWRISGIASNEEGSIVITGRTSARYKSHITVININGKVFCQMKQKDNYGQPDRLCAYLSEFKLATVSDYNQIGIFDFRDNSYIKKNISDVISSLPSDGFAWCVATDPGNNQVFVGVNSRDVYVFDDQLNFHHTLKLPERIRCPHDITISEGNLLVCDRKGTEAYIVTIEEPGGKLIHRFSKPESLDPHDWRPLSVCTDSKGFIYILWTTGSSYTAGTKALTQYTQDGSRLQTAIQLDCNDARCITTVKMNKTEKLLVAAFQSGKLYSYTITRTIAMSTM